MVTVLANIGDLAESGYTFGGWNTQANGLGVTYQPGETFTIEAPTTLYPIFTLVSPPTTDALTYSSGTATSGSAPVDANSPYVPGSVVTVLANTGDLAESGYTFGGWNTQANGLGVTYQPGETFTIEAPTTLYPIFTLVSPPTTDALTYSSGTATSGSAPVDANSPYVPGSVVTVLANTGDLAESGYTFGGWNTQANGLGVTYQPGETFTIEAPTTLYPIFTLNQLAITTTSLPPASRCQSNYHQTLEGTGGVTPYAWTVTKGILPAGLTLNRQTGVISGTLSADATTETFSVTLSSADGESVSRTFTITVYDQLEITTPSLATATQREVDYSQTLEGEGGELPYTWTLTQGVLPAGLTLNPVTGTISGTLSATASSETFTVTLTSADGSVATRQFTIRVSPCPSDPPSPPPHPHGPPFWWGSAAPRRGFFW